MNKHIATTFFIWLVLTAAGYTLVIANLYPTVGSSEAEDFDRIFRILLIMGVPVFAFVIATVAYAMMGFRQKGNPETDGPPMHGRGMAPPIWLAITGGLAILTMIFPGLTGLSKLQSDKTGYGWGAEQAELEIKVTGFRWAWSLEYPQQAITLVGTKEELVLPVDTHIKFTVNSTDVLHSFWIPAFRMKIDAVPGRTTFVTVKPTELGDYASDSSYRLQCAELCGLDHSTMRFPVKVVSREDFNAWVRSKKSQAGGQ